MAGLEGRVALITGASRGIGAATGRVLAEEGVRVALASRSGGDAGIEGALGIACDVRAFGSLEQAVTNIVTNITHGPAGSTVEIVAWVYAVEAPTAHGTGASLVVDVLDRGPAFPPRSRTGCSYPSSAVPTPTRREAVWGSRRQRQRSLHTTDRWGSRAWRWDALLVVGPCV